MCEWNDCSPLPPKSLLLESPILEWKKDPNGLMIISQIRSSILLKIVVYIDMEHKNSVKNKRPLPFVW
ncbi:unnamed protein product [Larinioides sclopetarius]|uniref:Uncharacterized protein n=1 Tax=Larinioides sclopetarius TaxID=280406 RepID=A0AAV1Z8W9_9ARAC